VGAVLRDTEHRVAVLGGRKGMPRSLGSVYGGSVTRFLGGGLRGVETRVINTPGVGVWSNGVAVSRDGCTLLASDCEGGSDAIHEFSVADGSRCRVVGCKGVGPLQFNSPCQVCIAPDDFVFVADRRNNRVQVLTPSLDFHGFVGAGQLRGPCGVCVDADVVVASELLTHRVSVFNRCDGALLRRFGYKGSGRCQLLLPRGLCLMPACRHVAVADYGNHRVSVFSVAGGFIRHVGVGALYRPVGVACSAFDELVVADWRSNRVVVFGAGGDGTTTLFRGEYGAVGVHGGAVFAHASKSQVCVLFQ
jgi:DNA-binding beta-propeller fold protein YncE